MSTTSTFKEFIDSLKAIEKQIDELTAEADAIKDLIKEELTAAELDEIAVGDYKVMRALSDRIPAFLAASSPLRLIISRRSFGVHGK